MLQEKFLHDLGDIYDAEHRFVEGQSALLQATPDVTLKGGIQKHIVESQQQVANLKQVFQLLGEQARYAPCDAAKGIMAEAQKNFKEAGTPESCDCLIGGALMKAEHYEIASYRDLVLGAQELTQAEVAALLQQNLEQEEQTAQRLETSAPPIAAQGNATRGITGTRFLLDFVDLAMLPGTEGGMAGSGFERMGSLLPQVVPGRPVYDRHHRRVGDVVQVCPGRSGIPEDVALAKGLPPPRCPTTCHKTWSRP